MKKVNKTLYEYAGALHIHSNYSDGLRPIPEIAEIAARSGIDFLLFADHMTLEPLKMGMERWFGPVLSIIGYEINDADNHNHYLAFDLDEILPPQYTAKEYVHGVKQNGGIGFIAHPDEKRNMFKEHPPYPWTEWDVDEYDGIEIWNHASEWLEKLTHTNKYLRVLHPLKYLNGPEPETLERWDQLNTMKVVPGIGGLDAHAYPYRVGPLTIYIFRYKVLFRGIRTHVLLDEKISDDVTEAKDAVLSALKSSHCFITNYRWGDAKGFRFSAIAGDAEITMGETVEATDAEFVITTPSKGEIYLLRNGVRIAEQVGNELRFSVSKPGAYRVEVKKKSKPWIYSNHIRLRGVSTHEHTK